MDMKQVWVVLVLAVVVVLAVVLWNYAGLMPQSTDQQGRFVVTLTDAAMDLNGVSEINVTIDSVRAHNDLDAWVTLSSTQQTFDLLKLKVSGNQVVIADLNVTSATYNQIELNISKAIVVDATGTHEAKLPSGKIRMNMDQNLARGSTNITTLDVLADESLHITGNGLYILAPVIRMQTRENATVSIDFEHNAIIRSGVLKDDAKIGMDANGSVGIGVGIPKNADISIGTDNKVHVGVVNNVFGN